MNRPAKSLIFAILCGGAGYWLYRNGYFDINGGEKMSDLKDKDKIVASNQAKFYGVTGGNSEILSIIEEVTRLYSFGANQNNLSRFLFEICAVESDFGNARDYTTLSGEGLTQFDKATYNEMKQSAIASGYKPYNIENTEYNALRKNPRLQIFMTRYFLYKRIPQAIPADIAGRAKQWKKYYNTHLGAGTESGYISKANKWYNKLGYKGV